MDRRAFLVGASTLALTGCSGVAVVAPQADVQRARYVHDRPPSVTLVTIKNVGSDNGAHSALLINARERVMFDGAGSFVSKSVPERNDVLFGMNPAAMDFYIDFHSRMEFYTQTQTVYLPLSSAEAIYQAALKAGPVPAALCTTRTTQVMKAAPEFAALRQSFFPNSLYNQVQRMPGVISREFRDNDATREAAIAYEWRGQAARNSIE
ncbi:MAG: hypothetical protein ACPG5U_03410 [Planktomarina sp.]